MEERTRTNRSLKNLTEEERREWRRKQTREAGARYREQHREEINRKERERYAARKNGKA